jgi:hypothetical protein
LFIWYYGEQYRMGIAEVIWPLFFPALGAAVSIVHIRVRRYTGAQVLETVLMWQLAFGLGLAFLWAGAGHLLVPDRIAESIGWPVGSPFQREVGLWDAALGITGLLCLKFRGEFWIAVLTGAGLFSIGAGIGHVYELVTNGTTAPGNAGLVMYMDILYPLVLAALLVMVWRARTPGRLPAGS